MYLTMFVFLMSALAPIRLTSFTQASTTSTFNSFTFTSSFSEINIPKARCYMKQNNKMNTITIKTNKAAKGITHLHNVGM